MGGQSCGARRRTDGVKGLWGVAARPCLLTGLVIAAALAVWGFAGPETVSARTVAAVAGPVQDVRADLAWAPDGAARIIPAAAPPEQNEKLVDWREEGIRMAAELTGIPEAFFRWLQDKGVPVGEFMRFLMPFLEWLDMVEPQNGTAPAPNGQPQDKPSQTTV